MDADSYHGYWLNSNGGMGAFEAREMRDDY